MNKFKKSFSLLVSIALISNVAAIPTYASWDMTNNYSSELDFQIFSNYDPEFPLCLNLDVDANSIKYEKLLEPIYDFEYALIEEELDFNTIISLKEDFNYCDEYTVKIITANYEEVIFDQTASKYCEMNVPGLEVGELYYFCVNVSNESIVNEYVGEFTVVREINNSLTIDLFYQKSATYGSVALATLPDNEYESNNTQSGADTLSNGIAMIGSISSSSDVDYFLYSTPVTGPSGIINLDISLSVPAGQKLRMLVTCAETGYSRTMTSVQSGTGLHLRIEDAGLNSKYYIKITKYSGSTGGNYYLTVNQDVKSAWYGQFYATLASVDYWNPNGLESVNLKSGAVAKPVFIQGNAVDNSEDWMEKACGVVSTAMILRNMGKTMYGYDVRTGYTGQMMADPYTAMLANFGLDGIDKDYSEDITSDCGHSPDTLYSGTIASEFGAKVNRKEYMDINNNYRRLATCTPGDIKSYIDTYGYALVYLKGNDWDHFMVFSGYRSSGTTMANTFYVYDPAASSYTTGANVLLSQTASGYSAKTYTDVISIAGFSNN